MKDIRIRTIPHRKQRYETSGDYWDDKSGAKIVVSKLHDERYEFLIAAHEMIEQFLCRYRGIKERDISDFDVQFEMERDMGVHDKDAEPGNAVDAPYRKEHFTATNIERLLASELGVDWEEYGNALDNLYNSKTIRRKVR